MKCSFCGNSVVQGKGKMFVKISGDVLIFCNSKCDKNWNMKRDPKKFKWTSKFVKT